MTTFYDASVCGREAKVGAGPEYLTFDMLLDDDDMHLEEEQETDIDEIEDLKKRQREGLYEKTPQRGESDQNSEQRKPS